MTEKYKNHAPFGFRAVRGVKIGYNPNLDKSGSYKRPITDAGPGTYDPKLYECKYKNGMDWAHKLQIEDFSKNMGWKNLSILEDRKYYKSLRGPGTHEIDLALFKPKLSSIYKNISFTSGQRFNYQKAPKTPAPDRYFQDIEKKRTLIPHRFSSLPTFEYDGFADRFRAGAPPGSRLPSNLYNAPDHDGKGTADIIKKLVSVRGPYDLFTGPRDSSTLKSFLSPPNFKSPDFWVITPGLAELMLDSTCRSRSGKFLKAMRFPKRPTERHMLDAIGLSYKDPNAPAPGHYEVEKYNCVMAQPPGLYPFNTSRSQARGTIKSSGPGPGRYTPKVPKCMKKKRATYVFLSKYQRNKYDIHDYRSF